MWWESGYERCVKTNCKCLPFIYYVIYVVIIYLFIYLSIYLWKLTTQNLTKWSAIHDVLTMMTFETVQM